jgi:outer membrane protein
MKALLVTVALGGTLMAGPVFAQASAGQAAPKPATPAVQQPAAATAQPPRPFPEGAKMAWVDVQSIASESSEGKAARVKIQALQTQRTTELQAKQKALEAAQAKLQSGGSVMSDSARDSATKDVEKLNRDFQRAQQDAQEEIQALTRDLQDEFQKKLLPLIGEVAAAKGLHMVFSGYDSGLLWADPGLNITAEVIKRLDTGATASAAPKK